MDSKHHGLRFPLWQYLNQPLFHPSVKLVISPKEFARLQHVDHLQRCWEQKPAQKENPHS